MLFLMTRHSPVWITNDSIHCSLPSNYQNLQKVGYDIVVFNGNVLSHAWHTWCKNGTNEKKMSCSLLIGHVQIFKLIDFRTMGLWIWITFFFIRTVVPWSVLQDQVGVSWPGGDSGWFAVTRPSLSAPRREPRSVVGRPLPPSIWAFSAAPCCTCRRSLWTATDRYYRDSHRHILDPRAPSSNESLFAYSQALFLMKV